MLVGLVCALGESRLMPFYQQNANSSVFGLRPAAVTGPAPGAARSAAAEAAQAARARPAAPAPSASASVPSVGLRGAWVPQVSPYLYEVKYLAESAQWPVVEQALSDLIAVNGPANGSGTYNHSIYFDSPAYRIYNERHSEDLVRVRPRLRIYRRSPGCTAADIYLELKRHYERVVAKRRARIGRELAEALLGDTVAGIEATTGMSSVLAEFAFLAQRFALRPSLSVLYHRSAYRCASVKGVRVTVDRIVQYGPTGDLDPGPESFSSALPPDQIVIEVKYGDTVPEALLGRMRRLGLTPCGFSKYDCALAAQAELLTESNML